MLPALPRFSTVFLSVLLLAAQTAAVSFARATAAPLAREEIVARADAQVPDALEAYRQLLRLPNDAAYPLDIRRVVDWLTVAFRAQGFDTRELSTPGSPLLLATRRSPGATRTALVYLQADGQPVDPSHWSQESPWQPVLKERDAEGRWQSLPWDRLRGRRDPEWRIFARSAADSKGPIVQFLAALRALAAASRPPGVHLKVIVDTEEELGSPHLPATVARHRDDLAADMLLILDGPPHASNRPTLTFGARGIATLTLTTWGPKMPQHSGHYGNWIPNPVFDLARLLASLKNERGQVTIPGFYDGVVLDGATRAQLARVPDDEEARRAALGYAEPEAVAASLQESLQYPSLNVRGIAAGWVGAQARTIIPARATAEIDVRLVKESDAERLLRLVREQIEGLGYTILDRPPTDDERRTRPHLVTMTSEVSYGAFRSGFDSEPGRWLARTLEGLYGEPPILLRTLGGSIPIAPFVETLAVPAVAMATVNPDNNQHSPDENLRLGNFVEGIRMILAVLAEEP